MERRDILKLGAVGALAGCAPRARISFHVPPPPAMSPHDVDRVLAGLDATLDTMAASQPSPQLFGLGKRTVDAAEAQRGHELTMRTLAAMHVAATFSELPEDARRRPDVQRRMWEAVPLMDAAMFDMADYVGSLTPREKRDLQTRLREVPSTGMDVVGVLDEHAAAVGIPARRRVQMRTIAAHASWRMARQSVDAMLGDTMEKVRRVQERHRLDEQVARAVSAKVVEAQMFDRDRGHAHLLLATAVPGRRSHRGDTVLTIGGVLLGLGVVAGVGGAILVANNGNNNDWIPGAILITVGSLMGLAGIICLIVGAVLKANDDRASADDD